MAMFPEPVTFDAFGAPYSHGAGLKVLEEAAELVEAVKGYERSLRCEGPSERDANADREFNRGRVLDEAMDVYQALANYSPGHVRRYVDRSRRRVDRRGRRVDSVRLDRDAALYVLAKAAVVYSRCWTVASGAAALYADVENAALSLERLLAGEFSDGEIAGAYERCMDRNRRRGRI